MQDVGPERALVYATIRRAVLDAAGMAGLRAWENKKFKREAAEWLFNWHHDESVPWSFRWCCDQLEIDHRSTQRAIVQELRSGRAARQGKGSGRGHGAIGEFLMHSAESPTQAEVYFL